MLHRYRLWMPICLSLALFWQLGTAGAQCPPMPNQLANGQPTDAPQMMANFDAVASCIGARGTVGSGSTDQVAVYPSAGTTVAGQAFASVLDTLLGSLPGLVFRDGATWASLAPGPIGYVLQSGGAAANPAWGAPGGGGGGGIGTVTAAGVSSGAPTVAIAGAIPISRPAAAALTWVNQSSATVTEHTNGPLVLRTTQTGGGVNISGLVKAVAGTSWTVTVQYAQGNRYGASNADSAGLLIHNSVNGRLYGAALWSNGTITINAYASPTSINSYPGSKAILLNPSSVWMRAQYVSATTTLTFYYSIDGFSWESVYSTSTLYTGVPTGYGIFVGSSNNAAGMAVSLNYMTESSP